MAPTRPTRPARGRNTKGGWRIRSILPPVDATGIGIGVGDWLGEDAIEGEGDSDGVGAELGVGVGEPCSRNWTHGCGVTLAQMLWAPGRSPANGFTLTPKLPCPSAVAEPTTLLGESQ